MKAYSFGPHGVWKAAITATGALLCTRHDHQGVANRIGTSLILDR